MQIEIVPIKDPYLPQAFALATEVFATQSTLHRALNVNLEAYRTYLAPSFDAMVAEKLSVVAVAPETQTVLGVMIATDFHHQFAPQSAAPDPFAPLQALTAELTRLYRRKYSITPGQVALVDMAAVATSANGHGLYRKMRTALHASAKHQGFEAVVGELSSAATQHVVLDRLGHQKIAEVTFASFEFEGKRPFETITDPARIILAQGQL